MTIKGCVRAAVVLGVFGVAVTNVARADLVVQDGTFATTGQDLFQPGAAPYNFTFDCLTAGCLNSGLGGITWGALSGGISGPSLIPVLPGSYSLTASLNPGYFGLSPTATVTGGALNVSYPVQLAYGVPHDTSAGDIVAVNTNYHATMGANLATMGEAYSATLNFVANISGNVTDTYFPLTGGSSTLFDVSPSVNINQEVASVSASNLSASWSPPGLSSGVSFNVPNQLNLNTATNNCGTNGTKISVCGAARPPVLSLDLDAGDLIVAAVNSFGVPLPPLAQTFYLGALSYNIISGKLQVGPSLYQSFDWTQTGLPITLIANTGQVETGFVGQTFDFTAPASGNLVIDTEVGIDNNLHAIEGLSLGASFTLELLSAAAGPVKLGPLFTYSTPVATTGCLLCWTNTNFSLQGFNTLDNQLVIPVVPMPEPAGLAVMLTGLCILPVVRRAWRRETGLAS
jgi:hypothetical protein